MSRDLDDDRPPIPSPAAGRLLQPDDALALSDLFSSIDSTHFHPHPFTPHEAERIASYAGRDVYAVLQVNARFVAYGILRGWDDAFDVPSLGVGVRVDSQRRGYGRQMMEWLAAEAERRGANRIRLRVDADNLGARRLYEALGYVYAGEERGELVMVIDIRSR